MSWDSTDVARGLVPLQDQTAIPFNVCRIYVFKVFRQCSTQCCCFSIQLHTMASWPSRERFRLLISRFVRTRVCQQCFCKQGFVFCCQMPHTTVISVWMRLSNLSCNLQWKHQNSTTCDIGSLPQLEQWSSHTSLRNFCKVFPHLLCMGTAAEEKLYINFS